MDKIRFALGMIAAIADDYGNLEIRDKIHDAVPPNGRTSDGFDFIADNMSRFRRWMKRTF